MNRNKENRGAGAPDKPGVKLRIKNKLGLIDAPKIVAYRSYGNSSFLHVRGRLLEAKAQRGSDGNEDAGLFASVRETLQRLESDEIPGASIRAHYGGRRHDIYTDNEGYFQLDIIPDEAQEPGWADVRLELLDSTLNIDSAEATAEILVPPENATFAVVSDLDDTVIKSNATNKLEMTRRLLFEDPESRTPFNGVADLYHALMAGSAAEDSNPIFYLSRSGWNLYDMFLEFFEARNIPAGPMFLRDLSITEDKSMSLGTEHHKLARLRELLRAYPALPFILIGDSGQEDPETYRRIALENPGRIHAVYLRNVADEGKDGDVSAIVTDLEHRGIPTSLAARSEDFAEHMRSEGFIADHDPS